MTQQQTKKQFKQTRVTYEFAAINNKTMFFIITVIMLSKIGGMNDGERNVIIELRSVLLTLRYCNGLLRVKGTDRRKRKLRQDLIDYIILVTFRAV